jgi:hypothetical protein
MRRCVSVSKIEVGDLSLDSAEGGRELRLGVGKLDPSTRSYSNCS